MPPAHLRLSADASARALASEKRRLDRIAEREAATTCFACRGQGHSAKECPNQLDGAVEVDGVRTMQGRDAVNICYRSVASFNVHSSFIRREVLTISLPLRAPLCRCGSTSHTLKKCPRPLDPAKPMPFASCFVCLEKGHLASKCPQNAAKGIYPDGGCCGLCKGTDHLSRDCELRKNGAPPSPATLSRKLAHRLIST
jgi:zinc finger CCHC domain-containing protein 9